MTEPITAFAPATVANVSCGFDVLGFALEAPGDEVRAWRRDDLPAGSVVIAAIESGEGIDCSGISLEAEFNTAGKAAMALLAAARAPFGAELRIRKMMPAGSGMGSSAASAAAAAVAVNELLRRGGLRSYSPLELIPFGMEGEAVASGSYHADNVGPAITGGILLLRGYEPLDAVPIPPPERLCCAVALPRAEISTKAAREILPKEIPLKTAITQWGNLAGLIAGLMKSDYDLIRRSLHDAVAEPARAPLIPGFYDMRRAALDAGALGCGISGSGPATFALADSLDAARKAGEAMKSALDALGVGSALYVSRVTNTGAKILQASGAK